MVLAVVSQDVSVGDHLPDQVPVGVGGDAFPVDEEGPRGVVRLEHREHHGGPGQVGPVVEGQGDPSVKPRVVGRSDTAAGGAVRFAFGLEQLRVGVVEILLLLALVPGGTLAAHEAQDQPQDQTQDQSTPDPTQRSDKTSQWYAPDC